ncbi:Protein CBG09179 [Caenorhabditis briggsae]|uniref:Protein CBG09179 n=1 Tax=Caenorhabditis briggsae TaxID=6238 RepID=A8X889_CAEBR|nr:Protein CBG09179 [Caenorhabditis briggsae]CAP28850.2 Protein CBG09179 [Caenorhabditis briggsae]
MPLDSSQMFCALLISIMLSLFIKSVVFPEKRKRIQKTELARKNNNTTVNAAMTNRRPLIILHDVMELRNLSMVELQTFNGQFSKLTDRYWREIFRRQNDAHHPDHINVSRLQTSNIITVLDENLPQGAIQELTITGLVPKPFSSRRCEVMRYLRERLSSSPNVELTFQGDALRITNPENQNSSATNKDE